MFPLPMDMRRIKYNTNNNQTLINFIRILIDKWKLVDRTQWCTIYINLMLFLNRCTIKKLEIFDMNRK